MRKCKYGIDVNIGSVSVDFGQGFYTNTNRKRAEAWAKRKSYVRNIAAGLVIIDFDEKKAKSIIREYSDDLKWAQFIINNRNGYDYIKKIINKDNNIDKKYDIVKGRIADLDVTDVAISLKSTKKEIADISRILNMNYPLQYSFHTQNALDCIREIEYLKI